MVYKERFELLKALCSSVPQNPNVDLISIPRAIIIIAYNAVKKIEV